MNKYSYRPRRLEGVLKKTVKQFPSLVVTGPRQSGKSTLLRELFSKTHAYLSFDDLAVRERAVSDPRAFLEDVGPRMIIDELQYAPQILSYIKMMIDEKRQERGRFIFTGSQQFTLIENLGDSLAGRIAIFELLPFSVFEKQESAKNQPEKLDGQKSFVGACLRGLFPELVVDKNLNTGTWFNAYLQTYLERDVRTIHNIGNLRDFQRCIQLLASRCSQILNLSSLSAELGVAVNTIKRWISILEASRMIYLLMPYYQNFGKRIVKSPKVYFLDCGLVCYLLGIEDKKFLLNGPMAGALFENFCIQETIKPFFQRGIRPRLYYMRSQNGLEIDLIIERNTRLYPVEFKKTKTPMLKIAQSIVRYKKLFPKLPITAGKVVSLAQESRPLNREVFAFNIQDYLMWLEQI